MRNPAYLIVLVVMAIYFGPRLMDTMNRVRSADEITRVCGSIPRGDIMDHARGRCSQCVIDGGEWVANTNNNLGDILSGGTCQQKTGPRGPVPRAEETAAEVTGLKGSPVPGVYDDSTPFQTFTGNISVLVRGVDTFVSLGTLDAELGVVVDDETELVGIESSSTGIVWKLGEQYEVRGRVVDSSTVMDSWVDRESIVATKVTFIGGSLYRPQEELRLGIQFDSPSRTKAAIARGADVNEYLGRAIMFSPFSIVEQLVEGGADLDVIQGDQGETPLHVAVRGRGDESIISLLLDKGADATIENKWGRDASHTHCRKKGAIENGARLPSPCKKAFRNHKIPYYEE